MANRSAEGVPSPPSLGQQSEDIVEEAECDSEGEDTDEADKESHHMYLGTDDE